MDTPDAAQRESEGSRPAGERGTPKARRVAEEVEQAQEAPVQGALGRIASVAHPVSRVEVSGDDLRVVVGQLVARISDLEARVLTLENPDPMGRSTMEEHEQQEAPEPQTPSEAEEAREEQAHPGKVPGEGSGPAEGGTDGADTPEVDDSSATGAGLSGGASTEGGTETAGGDATGAGGSGGAEPSR